MTILGEILENKRREVEFLRTRCTESEWRARARDRIPAPSFSGALRSAPMGVIAEVKRRSPSAGVIRAPFDPADIARMYASGGACAVSVLMDERYFGGGESDFRAVRDAVALPLLFKEFVVDPWQVWQASGLGASAVLLIAAALSDAAMGRLMDACGEAGVEPLLEVHDAPELGRAVEGGATLIGINNRDLRTFRTDLATTLALAASVPKDRLLVSESGIRTAADLVRLHEAGARAALVGEHLLRDPDPGAALRVLLQPFAVG